MHPFEPIERLEYAAQTLMQDHPPVWLHENKRLAYAIACPPGCHHSGSIRYSRWRAMPLPDSITIGGAADRVEGREDIYDYVPLSQPAYATEWHVNFADPNLFVAYGTALLAQDEMQVLEHPALGALKEALAAGNHSSVTVEGGQPTPVLIKGVERRCRVTTDRNAAEGRPEGLYGNAFARAGAEALRRAVKRLQPPTLTNLIAIAAPHSGWGDYSAADIDKALVTAYAGFRAAAIESSETPVIVHTGFWGCGAFGGNRVLMALLQILAAEMAGIDRLVFHTFDRAGIAALKDALELVRTQLHQKPQSPEALIENLVARRFQWGESDGN